MRIHYYRAPGGNFGDDLNGWMWHALIPDAIGLDGDLVMIGIGTLLNRDINDRFPHVRRWAAMGSGVGYGPPPRGLERGGLDHITVRGPLSARVLRLPEDRIGTDGAILLAGLAEGAPVEQARRADTVFMPHHHNPDLPLWQDACRRAGIRYIDPTADSRAILKTLRHAKLVIAEAMHAAIVADTVRVPWVPFATWPGVSSFKWLDWTLSMELPYAPHVTPLLGSRARREAGRLRWTDAGELVDPPTPEAAFAAYEAVRHARGHLAPRVRRYVRRQMFQLGVKPFLPRRAADEQSIDLASRCLADLQRGAGYLSTDAIFSARRALMQERLRAVAAAAASPAS